VGPAHTVAVALGLIEATSPDAAILDMNLGKELSYPAADALRVRRIPFMFLTGYIAPGIDARFHNELVMTKPFDFEKVRQALNHLLDPSRSVQGLNITQEIAEVCMTEEGKADKVEELLATPNLADALESEQFRRFLDQVPIAIVVAEMKARERIVYANPGFEKLSGQTANEVEGKPWSVLRGQSVDGTERTLSEAVAEASDWVGTFRIELPGNEPAIVDAYSNIIVDDDGTPAFRLAALVDVRGHAPTDREDLETRIREKDTLLYEIQHRVKNNLQMITALIRLETRNVPRGMATAPFDRLAGRIESLQLLYQALTDHGLGHEVDLGVYLSQIASAVMRSHAVEGIRLDLKVDAYPVSVDVAMPTGLVVNELLTNALKHAFVGRDGGTITLHSLLENGGCRVLVADDGVGLPEGTEWPARGKLGALIIRSLRENAKAGIEVESRLGLGTRVSIVFSKAAAAPQAGY
jgi:two-component sensor histidine kinase